MQDSETLVANLNEELSSRFFGKYRGLVTEIGEGDQLGLIRAQIPEIFGEEDSPWAVACAPFAGAGHGLLLIPEVGDGVWIEFEAGDISKPIWTGFWWGSGEVPEPGGVTTRVFATSSGHKLVLDEEGDEVRLEHGGGPSIVLTASDITLKVGGKKIVISKSSVNVNGGSLEVK